MAVAVTKADGWWVEALRRTLYSRVARVCACESVGVCCIIRPLPWPLHSGPRVKSEVADLPGSVRTEVTGKDTWSQDRDP